MCMNKIKASKIVKHMPKDILCHIHRVLGSCWLTNRCTPQVQRFNFARLFSPYPANRVLMQRQK